ncbi:MAG: hypothetical protein EP315_06155 [Gammaproteobacteria bacterium]|nr:MAG: hypothetical protein EP315_06155 [Gammaproteobacteria bacterium]
MITLVHYRRYSSRPLPIFFLLCLLVCSVLFNGVEGAPSFSSSIITFDEAMFNDVQSTIPPLYVSEQWRRVRLLDNWYESHRDDAYPAWYRMTFEIHDMPGAWGVYLPAVNSNAVVWLNGERLGDGGDMSDPVARNWHRPLFFAVPKNLLHQGANILHVQLRPKNSGFGYLGPVHIGPDELLRPAFNRATLFKQTLIGASTVLLLCFSIFISLLWLKRRKDSLYGWFAAAGFSWTFFVFDMYVQHVPIQERLWDTLVFASVGGLVIFMTIFFFRFWGLSYPRYERFLLLFGLCGSITMYLVGDEHFYFVSSFVWDNVLIVFSSYMTWFIITQCMKWPSTEAWLLAIALLVVVAFGGHDNLVQMGFLPVDNMHLLPYGAPFFLGVVVWMLVQRFVSALEESEKLNQELDLRVVEKSRELGEQYRQIKTIEKEKILAQERERIMRDMHDGTGGHLVAAMAQVEKGDVDKTVLMTTLQNALDDIRLMIDSLDPVDGDVVSVLAMLRSRLEPRLQYSGIRVVWKVEDVPAIPDFGPEKVLQVMHILHEAVTNIIKHARASVITFRTGVIESGQGRKNVFIEIGDDGCGLGEDLREGHGLSNMYYRAALVQSRLELINPGKGCVVRLLLPIC